MLQFHLLFIRSGEVQNIVYETKKSLAAVSYALDAILLIGGQVLIQEEAGKADYCIHGRPEFVGHH